ncbi:MAG: hypothetical protein KAX57_06165 [Rhodoferax sp.]|uniref:hypothetical protein n=1 Tax=Rhodoferax sp. TaxID=50421 RepID=UPI001B53C78D|nr:hypothetical protein [Rhodoferax sp.]MBP8286408.1 hypothetical protein [Rhodoferax sp.]MBP9149123.1 hypothetical protein [Rhodoferax sp.]MBP9737967.1 hypothetical protein [Rhodoferax sp.]
MKSTVTTFLAATCLLFGALANAAQTVTYRIAHTRQQDTNMVFVVTNSSFFNADNNAKERMWTAMRSCAKSARLAGDVVMVASVNGGFRFYGPKGWISYLSNLDMAWVNARLNKKLTCTF